MSPYVIPQLEGYLSIPAAAARLRISRQRLTALVGRGDFPSARAINPRCYVIAAAEVEARAAERDVPRCGCCTEMNAAIAAHVDTVKRALHALHIRPGASDYSAYNDYDSAFSDGTEALWKALRTVDPERMTVGAYLYYRVYQSVIDGRRKRGVDQRRSREVRERQAAVLSAASFETEGDPVTSTATEWGEASDDDRAQRLVKLAARVDPQLPAILAGLARADTQVEIAEDLGLTPGEISRKVGALRAYAVQFPDLQWRPGAVWSARKWTLSRSQD